MFLHSYVKIHPLLVKAWSDLAPLAAWLRRESPDVLISPSTKEIQAHLRAIDWKIPKNIGLTSLACPEVDDAGSGISSMAG